MSEKEDKQMMSKSRTAVVIASCFALMALAIEPALATTFNFAPDADAFVNFNRASTNKGRAAALRVRNDIKRAYFRFNVSIPADESVTSATFRVFATSAPFCAQGAQLLRAANDTWGEATITWNNQPGPAALLETVSTWSPNGYVTFDVSEAVTGSGSVSFVLRHAPGCGASADAMFQSREGANDPQLIVETLSGPPPSPQCDDGVDNDGDNATDFPADPGCSGSADDDETDVAPPSGDVIVAVAGDIACRPGDTSHPCHHQQTSDLVVADPTITDVLVLGDNQYEVGALSDYRAAYDPTWGRFKAITHPSPGNHEYQTTNAQGYRSYFETGTGPLWYSFDRGGWHIVALDSNCRHIGGCSSSSPQGQFLSNDLQSDGHSCELLFWHHPLFSSSADDTNNVRQLWQVAYENGVDVILNGHEHNYERFAPQTPSAAVDPASGIRQFVVGTGGKSLYPIGSRDANSEVANDSTFGILKISLGATSYTWEFVPESSGVFSDSGTASCH